VYNKTDELHTHKVDSYKSFINSPQKELKANKTLKTVNLYNTVTI